MSLSSFALRAGLKTLMTAAHTFLTPAVRLRHHEEAARQFYVDKDRLVAQGYSEADASNRITSISERKTALAKGFIDNGLGIRLRGALAHYEAGDQFECIRHLLLFLGHLCVILDWKETSQYLERQAAALYEEHQRKAA